MSNSDPASRVWYAYDVAPDLKLLNKRVFHDASSSTQRGVPDGLAVDVHGHVFATGPGGVWVIDPDGVLLGTISPPEQPANVGFGEDGQALFITARSGLYRIRLGTTGLVH